MTYYKDSEARQVDGPNSQKFWFPIQFTSMREATSNDIPAGGTAAAAGGQLAKDTTPILEFTDGDTDSALRLKWAASNSDAVVFQLPLPPNLDPSEDVSIKLRAAMEGTTDSVVVAADSYFDSGDTKVEDNSGTVSGTAHATYTVTLASTDIPIGANSLTVELTPGSHTTDVFYLYSCWVEGTYIP